MWFWIISVVTGSIVGNATSSWFEKTALGKWFFKKLEGTYNWAAHRYGLEILKSEDKWRKKYPNVAKQIADLDARLKKLESK